LETWNVFRKRQYVTMQRAQCMLSIHRYVEHFCIECSRLRPRLTYLTENKTNLDSRLCTRPIFPPSTQQIILLELYWLIYPHQKKKVLCFYRIKVLTKPVFEVYREPVLTKSWRLTNGLVLYQTRPSGLVSFSFWTGGGGGVLVGSSHGGHRIPISPSRSRFTPDWFCLALFDRVLMAELFNTCKILFFS